MFRAAHRHSKHVEPSISFGIIHSITKLPLVGISTESSTMHGSMNIKFTIKLHMDMHTSTYQLLATYDYAWFVDTDHASVP